MSTTATANERNIVTSCISENSDHPSLWIQLPFPQKTTWGKQTSLGGRKQGQFLMSLILGPSWEESGALFCVSLYVDFNGLL